MFLLHSTIPLCPKFNFSSLLPSSVAVHPGLCWTWSETPKTGFLVMRLICHNLKVKAEEEIRCVFDDN